MPLPREFPPLFARRALNFFVLICCLTLVPAPAGGTIASLPAQNWNAASLARIKAIQPGAITFAVMGDCRDDNPAVFIQLLRQEEADPEVGFAVMLGDLVQTSGLEQYRTFVRRVRENLFKPLLAVVGNHDLSGSSPQLYQAIFGPSYYSFQLKDHYFIMVDDAFPKNLDEAQMAWLERELQKAQGCRTRLVFCHQPLFDPRGGDHRHALPPAAGSRLAALFKKYQVTHIFAGHIHGYFTGHWDGVPFTITAGAGATLYGEDPAHFFFHYLKVSLVGDQVRIEVRRVAFPAGSRLPRPQAQVCSTARRLAHPAGPEEGLSCLR